MQQSLNIVQKPLSPSIISIDNNHHSSNYNQYRIPYLQTKLSIRKRNHKSVQQSLASNDSFNYYVQRQTKEVQKAQIKTDSRVKKKSINNSFAVQNSPVAKYLLNASRRKKQQNIIKGVSRYLNSQNKKKRSQVKRVMSQATQAKQTDERLFQYLRNMKKKQKIQLNKKYSLHKSNIILPNINNKKSTKTQRILKSPLFPQRQQYQQSHQTVRLSFFHLHTQFLKQRTTCSQIYFAYRRQNILKNKALIPSIPAKHQLQTFIINYNSINPQIDINSLLKGNFCVVEYSPKQLYIGQMISKHKNGYGILINSKICFQGLWKNNQKIKGVQITMHGTFKGNYLNNLRDGQGQFQRHNGQIYVGQWSKGKKHGNGLWINQNGESYTGQWRFGKVQGKGRLILKERCYQGYFSNFLQQGFGKQSFANGDTFQGIYKGNLPNGKGTYSWKNGSQYTGMFLNGMRHGIGAFNSDQQIYFHGSFARDKPEGQCQILLPDKKTYKGTIQYTPISNFSQKKISYNIILDKVNNVKGRIKNIGLEAS